MIENILISAFPDHIAADKAVHALYHAGFEMGDVSVVGKDVLTARDPTGYYSQAETTSLLTKATVATGAGLGLLAGFAVAGPFVLLGPIAALATGAAIGGVAGLGLGQLFPHLMEMNEPDSVLEAFEQMLELGNFLLLIHSDKATAARAIPILNEVGAIQTRLLAEPGWGAESGPKPAASLS